MAIDDETGSEALARPLASPTRERAFECAHDELVRELRLHQAELEAQNEALREARTELEESRRRYRDLYDFAPIPYLTFDVRGCVVEANRTAAESLGFEQGYLRGRPFLAFARSLDSTLFFRHLRECLATRGPVVAEMRFTTRLGPREFRVTSTAALGPGGGRRVVRSAFFDLGALKDKEREQQRACAAEEELRRLKRIAGAHIAITQAVARMQSGDAVPILQVLADQTRLVTGASYAAVGIGDDTDAAFARWIASSDEDGAAGLAVAPRPRRHGALGVARERSHGSLRVPLVHGDHGIGELYVANRPGGDELTAADEVSASLLAQRASVAVEIALMIGRERRRNALLDAAGRALATKVDAGDVAATIVDLAVPELGDGAVLSLASSKGELRVVAAHHRDSARAESLRAQVGATWEAPEPATSVDARAPRAFCEVGAAEGPRSGAATLLLPLLREGDVVGVLHLTSENPTPATYGENDLALAVELAHRASMALENARLHEIARRALAARDEILAFVTHDLGNFLNAIVLNAHAILRTDGAERPPEVDTAVKAIRSAAGRMTVLLDALRDASSIEAGRFRVDARPSHVAPLLGEAAAIFHAKAQAKRVHLDVVVDGDLPMVALDRERIHQVVANLLSNALDHTPPGGHVQLEATEIAPGALRIAVHDTGPGIGADDVPHLFDRYWHKDSPTRRGTGLGLYIAQGIVEAHGGHIGVDTETGHGASFHFTLPVPARDPADAPPLAELEPRALH